MTYHVINADARATGLPDAFFHCVATSPPYFGLREYGDDDREIGDEKTPAEYVAEMVKVGREVRRVMRNDGVWWLNLGDSFASAGSGPQGDSPTARPGNRIAAEQAKRKDKNAGGTIKNKSLLMIPQRVALALQDDGWIIRAQIPWVKASAMPESVRDRPTVAHEYVFQLVKQPRYFWDPDAVRVEHAIGNGGRQRAALRETFDYANTDRKVRHVGNGHANLDDCHYNPNGRNIRTSDFFHAGLDELQSHIAHVRENGGMMLSDEGDPLAFLINSVGSKLAHFAMWPPKLVKPMILSSTSEKGCCPQCGAQWRRDTRSHTEAPAERPGNKPIRYMAAAVAGQGQTNMSHSNLGMVKRVETIGFSPSCECNAGDPVPCRVLDPFAGSGTTLQVCESLGRDSWGVELMAKNLPIIDERMKEKLDPQTMKPAKKYLVKGRETKHKSLTDLHAEYMAKLLPMAAE
jgi:DNA modification methylase